MSQESEGFIDKSFATRYEAHIKSLFESLSSLDESRGKRGAGRTSLADYKEMYDIVEQIVDYFKLPGTSSRISNKMSISSGIDTSYDFNESRDQGDVVPEGDAVSPALILGQQFCCNIVMKVLHSYVEPQLEAFLKTHKDKSILLQETSKSTSRSSLLPSDKIEKLRREVSSVLLKLVRAIHMNIPTGIAHSAAATTRGTGGATIAGTPFLYKNGATLRLLLDHIMEVLNSKMFVNLHLSNSIINLESSTTSKYALLSTGVGIDYANLLSFLLSFHAYQSFFSAADLAPLASVFLHFLLVRNPFSVKYEAGKMLGTLSASGQLGSGGTTVSIHGIKEVVFKTWQRDIIAELTTYAKTLRAICTVPNFLSSTAVTSNELNETVLSLPAFFLTLLAVLAVHHGVEPRVVLISEENNSQIRADYGLFGTGSASTGRSFEGNQFLSMPDGELQAQLLELTAYVLQRTQHSSWVLLKKDYTHLLGVLCTPSAINASVELQSELVQYFALAADGRKNTLYIIASYVRLFLSVWDSLSEKRNRWRFAVLNFIYIYLYVAFADVFVDFVNPKESSLSLSENVSAKLAVLSPNEESDSAVPSNALDTCHLQLLHKQLYPFLCYFLDPHVRTPQSRVPSSSTRVGASLPSSHAGSHYGQLRYNMTNLLTVRELYEMVYPAYFTVANDNLRTNLPLPSYIDALSKGVIDTLPSALVRNKETNMRSFAFAVSNKKQSMRMTFELCAIVIFLIKRTKRDYLTVATATHDLNGGNEDKSEFEGGSQSTQDTDSMEGEMSCKPLSNKAESLSVLDSAFRCIRSLANPLLTSSLRNCETSPSTAQEACRKITVIVGGDHKSSDFFASHHTAEWWPSALAWLQVLASPFSVFSLSSTELFQLVPVLLFALESVQCGDAGRARLRSDGLLSATGRDSSHASAVLNLILAALSTAIAWLTTSVSNKNLPGLRSVLGDLLRYAWLVVAPLSTGTSSQPSEQHYRTLTVILHSLRLVRNYSLPLPPSLTSISRCKHFKCGFIDTPVHHPGSPESSEKSMDDPNTAQHTITPFCPAVAQFLVASMGFRAYFVNEDAQGYAATAANNIYEFARSQGVGRTEKISGMFTYIPFDINLPPLIDIATITLYIVNGIATNQCQLAPSVVALCQELQLCSAKGDAAALQRALPAVLAEPSETQNFVGPNLFYYYQAQREGVLGPHAPVAPMSATLCTNSCEAITARVSPLIAAADSYSLANESLCTFPVMTWFVNYISSCGTNGIAGEDQTDSRSLHTYEHFLHAINRHVSSEEEEDNLDAIVAASIYNDTTLAGEASRARLAFECLLAAHSHNALSLLPFVMENMNFQSAAEHLTSLSVNSNDIFSVGSVAFTKLVQRIAPVSMFSGYLSCVFTETIALRTLLNPCISNLIIPQQNENYSGVDNSNCDFSTFLFSKNRVSAQPVPSFSEHIQTAIMKVFVSLYVVCNALTSPLSDGSYVPAISTCCVVASTALCALRALLTWRAMGVIGSPLFSSNTAQTTELIKLLSGELSAAKSAEILHDCDIDVVVISLIHLFTRVLGDVMHNELSLSCSDLASCAHSGLLYRHDGKEEISFQKLLWGLESVLSSMRLLCESFLKHNDFGVIVRFWISEAFPQLRSAHMHNLGRISEWVQNTTFSLLALQHRYPLVVFDLFAHEEVERPLHSKSASPTDTAVQMLPHFSVAGDTEIDILQIFPLICEGHCRAQFFGFAGEVLCKNQLKQDSGEGNLNVASRTSLLYVVVKCIELSCEILAVLYAESSSFSQLSCAQNIFGENEKTAIISNSRARTEEKINSSAVTCKAIQVVDLVSEIEEGEEEMPSKEKLYSADKTSTGVYKPLLNDVELVEKVRNLFKFTFFLLFPFSVSSTDLSSITKSEEQLCVTHPPALLISVIRPLLCLLIRLSCADSAYFSQFCSGENVERSLKTSESLTKKTFKGTNNSLVLVLELINGFIRFNYAHVAMGDLLEAVSTLGDLSHFGCEAAAGRTEIACSSFSLVKWAALNIIKPLRQYDSGDVPDLVSCLASTGLAAKMAVSRQSAGDVQAEFETYLSSKALPNAAMSDSVISSEFTSKLLHFSLSGLNFNCGVWFSKDKPVPLTNPHGYVVTEFVRVLLLRVAEALLRRGDGCGWSTGLGKLLFMYLTNRVTSTRSHHESSASQRVMHTSGLIQAVAARFCGTPVQLFPRKLAVLGDLIVQVNIAIMASFNASADISSEAPLVALVQAELPNAWITCSQVEFLIFSYIVDLYASQTKVQWKLSLLQALDALCLRSSSERACAPLVASPRPAILNSYISHIEATETSTKLLTIEKRVIPRVKLQLRPRAVLLSAHRFDLLFKWLYTLGKSAEEFPCGLFSFDTTTRSPTCSLSSIFPRAWIPETLTLLILAAHKPIFSTDRAATDTLGKRVAFVEKLCGSSLPRLVASHFVSIVAMLLLCEAVVTSNRREDLEHNTETFSKQHLDNLQDLRIAATRSLERLREQLVPKVFDALLHQLRVPIALWILAEADPLSSGEIPDTPPHFSFSTAERAVLSLVQRLGFQDPRELVGGSLSNHKILEETQQELCRLLWLLETIHKIAVTANCSDVLLLQNCGSGCSGEIFIRLLGTFVRGRVQDAIALAPLFSPLHVARESGGEMTCIFRSCAPARLTSVLHFVLTRLLPPCVFSHTSPVTDVAISILCGRLNTTPLMRHSPLCPVSAALKYVWEAANNGTCTATKVPKRVYLSTVSSLTAALFSQEITSANEKISLQSSLRSTLKFIRISEGTENRFVQQSQRKRSRSDNEEEMLFLFFSLKEVILVLKHINQCLSNLNSAEVPYKQLLLTILSSLLSVPAVRQAVCTLIVNESQYLDEAGLLLGAEPLWTTRFHLDSSKAFFRSYLFVHEGEEICISLPCSSICNKEGIAQEVQNLFMDIASEDDNSFTLLTDALIQLIRELLVLTNWYGETDGNTSSRTHNFISFAVLDVIRLIVGCFVQSGNIGLLLRADLSAEAAMSRGKDGFPFKKTIFSSIDLTALLHEHTHLIDQELEKTVRRESDYVGNVQYLRSSDPSSSMNANQELSDEMLKAALEGTLQQGEGYVALVNFAPLFLVNFNNTPESLASFENVLLRSYILLISRTYALAVGDGPKTDPSIAVIAQNALREMMLNRSQNDVLGKCLIVFQQFSGKMFEKLVNFGKLPKDEGEEGVLTASLNSLLHGTVTTGVADNQCENTESNNNLFIDALFDNDGTSKTSYSLFNALVDDAFWNILKRDKTQLRVLAALLANYIVADATNLKRFPASLVSILQPLVPLLLGSIWLSSTIFPLLLLHISMLPRAHSFPLEKATCSSSSSPKTPTPTTPNSLLAPRTNSAHSVLSKKGLVASPAWVGSCLAVRFHQLFEASRSPNAKVCIDTIRTILSSLNFVYAGRMSLSDSPAALLGQSIIRSDLFGDYQASTAPRDAYWYCERSTAECIIPESAFSLHVSFPVALPLTLLAHVGKVIQNANLTLFLSELSFENLFSDFTRDTSLSPARETAPRMLERPLPAQQREARVDAVYLQRRTDVNASDTDVIEQALRRNLRGIGFIHNSSENILNPPLEKGFTGLVQMLRDTEAELKDACAKASDDETTMHERRTLTTIIGKLRVRVMFIQSSLDCHKRLVNCFTELVSPLLYSLAAKGDGEGVKMLALRPEALPYLHNDDGKLRHALTGNWLLAPEQLHAVVAYVNSVDSIDALRSESSKKVASWGQFNQCDAGGWFAKTTFCLNKALHSVSADNSQASYVRNLVGDARRIVAAALSPESCIEAAILADCLVHVEGFSGGEMKQLKANHKNVFDTLLLKQNTTELLESTDRMLLSITTRSETEVLHHTLTAFNSCNPASIRMLLGINSLLSTSTEAFERAQSADVAVPLVQLMRGYVLDSVGDQAGALRIFSTVVPPAVYRACEALHIDIDRPEGRSHKSISAPKIDETQSIICLRALFMRVKNATDLCVSALSRGLSGTISSEDRDCGSLILALAESVRATFLLNADTQTLSMRDIVTASDLCGMLKELDYFVTGVGNSIRLGRNICGSTSAHFSKRSYDVAARKNREAQSLRWVRDALDKRSVASRLGEFFGMYTLLQRQTSALYFTYALLLDRLITDIHAKYRSCFSALRQLVTTDEVVISRLENQLGKVESSRKGDFAIAIDNQNIANITTKDHRTIKTSINNLGLENKALKDELKKVSASYDSYRITAVFALCAHLRLNSSYVATAEIATRIGHEMSESSGAPPLNAMTVNTSAVQDLQSMFKLIKLWFGDNNDETNSEGDTTSDSFYREFGVVANVKKNMFEHYSAEEHTKLLATLLEIPPHKFLVVFPQLTAHLGDKICATVKSPRETSPSSCSSNDSLANCNVENCAVEALEKIIASVCYYHPFHTLFQLHSIKNEDRYSSIDNQNLKLIISERIQCATAVLERICTDGEYCKASLNRSTQSEKEIVTKTKPFPPNTLSPYSYFINNVVGQVGLVAEAYLELGFVNSKGLQRQKSYPISSDFLIASHISQCKNVVVPTIPVPVFSELALNAGAFLNSNNCTSDTARSAYFNNPCLNYIHNFAMSYSICDGLSMPKRLRCISTTGLIVTQLLKTDDDPKQDCIIEQVFSLANSLFFSAAAKREGVGSSTAHDPLVSPQCGLFYDHQEGHKTNELLTRGLTVESALTSLGLRGGSDGVVRGTHSPFSGLYMRTYIVVPLSPTAAVLQWVENTETLSSYLIGVEVNDGRGNRVFNGAHTRRFPNDLSYQECHRLLDDAQKAQRNLGVDTRTNIPSSTKRCLLDVYNKFTPAMHYYFYEHFVTPSAAYSARHRYVNSVASSSIVGYVVGLGDRHLKNLLIDYSTGDMLHIDHGRSFDYGALLLKCPELVPFRLTRDVVDGMGVFGMGCEWLELQEKSAKSSTGAFQHKSTRTMSVLRENRDLLMCAISNFLLDGNPIGRWAVDLSKFSEILSRATRGMTADQTINVEPEDKQKAGVKGYIVRALQRVQARLIGLEGTERLTVEGQVQKLINDATDTDKLSKMYIGWSPFV